MERDSEGSGTTEPLESLDTVSPPTATDDGPIAPPAVAVVPGLQVVDPRHYTIGDEISRGGMGRIRAAFDRRLGRNVALKEMLAPDAAHTRRFEREVFVSARLQHPSIVSIYEAGRWPSGEPFYAMKLVEGRPLKKVIAEAMTLDARLALLPNVLAVADAMAYAHDKRIIHRDLKPANVLVGAFGETVVIDWGLAKELDVDEPEAAHVDAPAGDANLTRAGTVIGTPNYMPPEQAAGHPVDERADVYALGAMLYHLLAGEPPYRGESSAEVLAKVAAGPPAPLATVSPGAPADLLAIVDRAMARQPRARYRTARELAEDLRRFQSGQLVASHEYTRGELVRRFLKRNRALLSAAAIALVAITIIGGIAIAQVIGERDRARAARTRAERERAIAQLRADELTIREAKDVLARDPAAAIARLQSLSPGSSQLGAARVLASDARSRRFGRVGKGHDGLIVAVAVSGDSKTIATAGVDRTVRVWDVATLTPKTLGHHDERATSVAISADGNRVASGSFDRTVRVWSLGGAAPITLPHQSPPLYLAFSPSGDWLATTSTDRNVKIWDLTTRQLHLSTPGGFDTFAFAPDGSSVTLIGGNEIMRVVDLTTREQRPINEVRPAFDSYAISPDGVHVVYADKHAVKQWSAGKLRVLHSTTDRTPLQMGCRLGITHDGALAAGTCFGFGGVEVWRAGDSYTLTHASSTRYPIFSPDGKRLLLADLRDRAQLWVIASEESIELAGPEGAAFFRFSPDGSHIVAIAGADLWVWPADDVKRVAFVHPDPRQVSYLDDGRLLTSGNDGAIRMHGDELERVELGAYLGRVAIHGDQVAALGADGKVRVVSLATRAIRELPGTIAVTPRDGPADPAIERLRASAGQGWHIRQLERRGSRQQHEYGGQIAYVAFAPYGRAVAAVDLKECRITRWALPSGKVRIHECGAADIEVLAFASADLLLAATSDGRIHAFGDAGNFVLEGHDAPIEVLAIAPGGKRVISAGADQTVRVWDLDTHTSRVLGRHTSTVTHVAVSSDGEWIASAGDDQQLQVWDRATETPRRITLGGSYGIAALRFSSDGETIVVASNQVSACDVGTLTCRTLASSKPPNDAAIAPDGSRIAAASHNGQIWLWPDDLPRDEAALRAWLAKPTL